MRDLKNEDLSAILAAEPSEPARDLNSEDLSPIPETEPREPERDLARPLVSEAAIDNDPDRDLNSELFSTLLSQTRG